MLKFVIIIGDEKTSTVPRSAVTVIKVLNPTDHLEEISTLTILKITDTNIGTILEHRIQTNWQFMVIITCVLIAFALAYIWQCVHRHWKSRYNQVRNTNTTAPNTATNENHQIGCFYEVIQSAEYEDPERYRTIALVDNGRNDLNNSQEKFDSVSIIPIRSSSESSSDEALNGPHVSANTMYENHSEIEITEKRDLYLIPIM